MMSATEITIARIFCTPISVSAIDKPATTVAKLARKTAPKAPAPSTAKIAAAKAHIIAILKTYKLTERTEKSKPLTATLAATAVANAIAKVII